MSLLLGHTTAGFMLDNKEKSRKPALQAFGIYVISIKVPPFIVHRCTKNGGNFIKFGGDGGIRTLEPETG